MAARRRAPRRRRMVRRRRTTIPKQIASAFVYRVNRFTSSPKSNLAAGEAWVKRTLGGTLRCDAAANAQLNWSDLRAAWTTALGAPTRISWLAIWSSTFPGALIASFNLDNISQSNTGGVSNRAYNVSDQGTGTDLARVMIKIPYHLQLATDNSTGVVANIAGSANQLVYWRAGIKFQC